MATSNAPDMRDADLDPPLPGTLDRLGPNSHYYLRIVANPFLAIGELVVAYLAIASFSRFAFFEARPRLSVILQFLCFALGLILFPRLLHYHCLDCGATGRLARWRVHVCPKSSARYLAGKIRRFRGPTPGFQVLLWLGALLCTVLAMMRMLDT